MALKGCYLLVKYLVFLMNLIFWLTGLLILVLSLWMLTDPTFYVRMAQDESNYYAGVYLLLSVGLLLFIVGFLGCCGAYRESRNTLTLFFCFLLIVLVAQISAVVWGYANLDQLESLIRSNVASTVRHEYGVISSRTFTFDSIQEGLRCCGANGPSDWAESTFNNKPEKDALGLAISSTPSSYNIPLSCCSATTEVCKTVTKVAYSMPISPSIYHDLLETLRQYMNVFIGILATIGLVEFLGLLCSLILCCSVHVPDRYKN
ncbi:hypothetical protein M8J75_001588 [Diaphorina citri]|nr:hypothetical protein M8J75_001588 [Diaphorina citri]